MKWIPSFVGLLFLFVLAAFVPVLFWVYLGVGGFLLAAIFVRGRFAVQRKVGVDARVFGSSNRMRRYIRKAITGESTFWQLMPSKKKLLILVSGSIAILLVGTVIGATVLRVRNVGTIRAEGVEVYSDSGLSMVLEEIPWGVLDKGESKSFDTWILNSGNVAQRLNVYTESWNPWGVENSISLSWDYSDELIEAKEAIHVVFTLNVDPNINGVENFSFEVIIEVIPV